MSPYELAPGESLPGFLVRAASMRAFSGKNAFVLSLDGWVPSTDQTTWFKATLEGRIDLPSLSSLCSVSTSELQKGMIKLPDPSPGSPSDSSLATHRWRECPVCSDIHWYHRKSWALAFVTACPEHSVRLVDSCSDCRHPYGTGFMSNTFCAKCGSDRREPVQATAEELECSAVLTRLLQGGEHARPELIAVINRLMAALFMVTPDSLRGRFRASIQMDSIETLASIIPALWTIARSEETLAQALDSQARAMRSRWPALPGVGDIVGHRIDRVTQWNLPESAVAVTESWPFEIDFTHIPMDAAALASGYSPFVLHGLISDGLLSEHWFKDPEGDCYAGLTRLISIDELNAVIGAMNSRARPSSSYDGTNGSLYSIQYLDLAKVILANQQGTLPLYTMADGNDLGVPFRLTARYKACADLPSWAMTTSEACAALATYREMVDRMIRMGLLEGSLKEKCWHVISRDSVQRFNERYILVGTLAAQWKVNATNLTERLAALGIHPEPWGGTSSDGITAFRRGLALDEARDSLSMVTSYETKAGRKLSAIDPESVSPRRQRLLQLIREHGTLTELSRKSAVTNLSMVYRGERAFGDRLARKIERGLGLPVNWLDG